MGVACVFSDICNDIDQNDFECVCYDGWTDPLCETSPCVTNNQCQNQGTCSETMVPAGSGTSGYECICADNIEGEYCEVTPCTSDPCQNDGVCSFTISGNTASYECDCPAPFSGADCQYSPCNTYPAGDPCLNGGTC